MKDSRGCRHGKTASDLPAAALTCRLRTFLEFGGLLGSARRVSGAVGMRAGARELAFVDDQIQIYGGRAAAKVEYPWLIAEPRGELR